MKGYPQPLCEEFIYGSPERINPASFRLVMPIARLRNDGTQRLRERAYAHKKGR
ncbi:hypothetical protein Rifp1Sym_bb00350 [endosymbiont of Riftia pachyptila (vent Ph05)]|uniref:Uncharacterized protein n=2 Tax=sulfur-oxidizing symbionts TaxID=32036 RepID=G2FBV5_9GAMM|nr:hypothetical protein Rifp1Sym_bb00350 [endosymbiont of Riftia pachyptila (vent Ph05)]EGW55786.1 hypothetical protein TevJSym_ab01390 [endosymbiont of Tevnia jerichonana (vent Tica)]